MRPEYLPRPDRGPPRRSSHRNWGWALVLVIMGGLVVSKRLIAPRTPPASDIPSPAATATAGAALDPDLLRQFTALESAERLADATVWGPELRAQARAAWLESFWDRLNSDADGLTLLADIPLASLGYAGSGPEESLPHGIRRVRSVSEDAPRRPLHLRSWVRELREAGWRLHQSEWRHVRFVPATGDNPDTSTVEVRLDLLRVAPAVPARAQLHLRLRVGWGGEPGTASNTPLHAQAESWELLVREGEPAFHTMLEKEVVPFPRTTWIDPLVVRDLDDDGRPELLLCGRNLVLRRNPEGAWHEDILSPRHPGLVFSSVCADMSGDGFADLLFATRGGLVLVRGDAAGRFESPAETVWTAPERLEYAQALTCGDIDGDGDLDVFLGQYRTPYVGGQMPRPYFDARDGPPSYLLRNEGGGRLRDVTPASGLVDDRHRRTYGASLVDLDDDGDLDLLVTSDFAGMRWHANDGTGFFRTPVGGGLEAANGFGMSHTIQDFNSDGRLDVLMVAMPQPTADRLEALGLERPGFEAWRSARAGMVVGNRLYLGTGAGFAPRPFDPVLARTGWAWSGAAFDLDHDRRPDLHIVNGHESGPTVRDYESEFWTRDIYLPEGTPPKVAEAVFAARFAATRARGWSYGGYDRNRLLTLGLEIEAGHLFGVALTEDSRNVVAEDLDGDGDEDLVVTTFETWPRVRQTLRIFENRLPVSGHWIGLRLPEGPGVPSPIGAVIRIGDAQGTQVRTVITGDGYRSQSDARARFGLGSADRVDWVEVRYPGHPPRRWPPPGRVDAVHRLPMPPPRDP